jgi:hypothetical protein
MTFLVKTVTFDSQCRFTITFKSATGEEMTLLTNNWKHGFEVGKEVSFPVPEAPKPEVQKTEAAVQKPPAPPAPVVHAVQPIQVPKEK